MTPPFLNPFGRPHGGDLSSDASGVGEIRISPELRRLSEVMTRSRDLASERGRRSLADVLPNCAGNADCRPDLALLPAAIEQGRTAARGNPGLYRMVLNFLAAQLMNETDPAARERIQNEAREVGREALTAISNPGFNPPAEDEAHLDEPVRTRTRMLFDITCTLSALLARTGAEGYSDSDRTLLRDYFHQVLSGTEQTRIRSAINPNSPPFPDYFEHFVRAQAAMLDNDRAAAFRQLLAVRGELRSMDTERRGRALPVLVETSTELALQSMPRDPAGEHVETLRTLLSLEATGYFYQVDFSQSHAEAELAVAQRQAAALNIAAGILLNTGPGGDAQAVLDILRDGSGRREDLIRAMETRFGGDSAFQQGLRQLYRGNFDSADGRREIFASILDDARIVARHIHEHREAEPYLTVLRQDREGRVLPRAVSALEGNAALRTELRNALGLPETAEAASICRQLVELGDLLPAFLDSLSEAVRNEAGHRGFFDALRRAAQGYRGDGMRTNLEIPLVDLLEALNERARGDDVYAPAYHAFFQSLQNLETIAPDATLSPALRHSARRYAENLTNFSWGRVARHLSSPESIGMLAAGVALTELAPMVLVGAAGRSGELGSLVRGGQLTWRGELAVGMGIGAAMHLGSLGMHLAFNRAPGVGPIDELARLGPGTLALGFVTSMLAMGGTVLGGRLLRRGLLPEGAALSPGRLVLGHVGMRLGNWAIGGGLMLGAHSATAALTGHNAAPTGEQAAEVFLSMAIWDMTAAGLRFGISQSRLWRLQVGPYRANLMIRRNLEMMLRLAPELRGEQGFLESYLEAQLSNPARFQEITAALARREIPRLQGEGSARRLIFTPPPLAGDAPLTRTGAARAILQLTEPEAARVRRILNSEAFGADPEGVAAVRLRVRQRLGRGERNPIVWVRAHLEGDAIRFEILDGRPADEARENTFRMDANGIRELQTEDHVLRAVISGYQSETFTPILPPSPGMSSSRRARTEDDATAAHRPARAAATASEPTTSTPAPGEPGETAAATTAGGLPPVSARTVPPPVAPTATPVDSAPASPPPTETATPVAPPRPARPEPRMASGIAEDVDPQSITAPHQPTQALLEEAGLGGASEPDPEPPSATRPRPRRSDETVPFTPELARRARTATQPGARDDLTTTRRIEGAEAEAIRRRARGEPEPESEGEGVTRRIDEREAEELRRRLGAEAAADADPAAEPEAGGRESEAPIEVDPAEMEDAEPAARPADPPRDEMDFSGLMDEVEREAGDSSSGGSPEAMEGVTLRPPRVPTEASGISGPPPLPGARPAGPPPLPRRRPIASGSAALDAAIERDSDSAAPILLMRRRLVAIRPDPSGARTIDARSSFSSEAYEILAPHITELLPELYEAYRQTPNQEIFDIEVAPNGSMRLIDGAMNLLRQNEGYGYFAIRRRDGENGRPTFTIESLHLAPAMESAGWGRLLRAFLP